MLDATVAQVLSCLGMKKHYPLTIVLICSVCFLGLAVRVGAADKSDEKATAGKDLRLLVASKKLVEGKNLISTEDDGTKLFLVVKGKKKTWSAEKKDGTPQPLTFHLGKREKGKDPEVCTICHTQKVGNKTVLICQTVPCDSLPPANPDEQP
jgi:hypothetical protein